VARDELAAAALALMERHAITQLLIVDGAGRPDGILHLHDLLKATIA
jgi:arabinose-5-phosphate isomerase